MYNQLDFSFKVTPTPKVTIINLDDKINIYFYPNGEFRIGDKPLEELSEPIGKFSSVSLSPLGILFVNFECMVVTYNFRTRRLEICPLNSKYRERDLTL